MHGGRFQCCKACRPGKKMKKKLGGLNRASSTPRHPHSKTDGRKGDERLEQDGELLYEPKQFDVSVCLRRKAQRKAAAGEIRKTCPFLCQGLRQTYLCR